MLRQAPLAATERGRRLFVPPRGFNELVAFTAHGYHVLVLAERGGGKTSSLRQLQLMLGEGPKPSDPVAAFADLSTAPDREQAVLALIDAARLANSLSINSLDAIRPSGAGGGRIDALLGALERMPPTRFLVDNADPAAVGYPLFGGLRDRLWELNHQFIVSTDASDRTLIRPPADAFWEQIVELTLSEEQARDLIVRRAGPDADWAAELVSAVGAHPRRLIAAAQRIEAGQQSPEAAVREHALRRQRLAKLSPTGRRLFHELEDLGPTSPSDERLLRRVSVSRPAIDRGLRELEGTGLARSYFHADGPGRPRRLYELE